eukprot:GHVQ01038769.1.p2 GENE.GHVQ01038769.1~~GHVQ01038769.1.p2  ORF type:complete len:157 (+),score=8.30 GHVQ01038769.1:565-1035(+)
MHPQTDGQSERVIRTLNAYMRSYLQDTHHGWFRWLPVAEFSYNSSVQESTGYTPFCMVYGENPISPTVVETRVPEVRDRSAHARFIRIRRMLATCTENLRKAQAKQERQYNSRVSGDIQFPVGERLYVSSKILPPSYFIGKVRKFVANSVGEDKLS